MFQDKGIGDDRKVNHGRNASANTNSCTNRCDAPFFVHDRKTEMNIRILIGTVFVLAALFSLSIGALEFMRSIYPKLSEGHGAFTGALMGALFGLVAVALSAWFGFRSLKNANEYQAELHRQEEERQQEFDRRTLAAALHTELQTFEIHYNAVVAIHKASRDRITNLDGEDARPFLDSMIFPIPEPVIFNANIDKLGLLGTEAVAKIVHEYSSLRVDKYDIEMIQKSPLQDTKISIDDRIGVLSKLNGNFRGAIDALSEILPPDED